MPSTDAAFSNSILVSCSMRDPQKSLSHVMTDSHRSGKDKLAQGSRPSTIRVPPPPCMVVDEDLLKLGEAFYARRIMRPRAVLGAIHWHPGIEVPYRVRHKELHIERGRPPCRCRLIFCRQSISLPTLRYRSVAAMGMRTFQHPTDQE
jgi:hypothetical protein